MLAAFRACLKTNVACRRTRRRAAIRFVGQSTAKSTLSFDDSSAVLAEHKDRALAAFRKGRSGQDDFLDVATTLALKQMALKQMALKQMANWADPSNLPDPLLTDDRYLHAALALCFHKSVYAARGIESIANNASGLCFVEEPSVGNSHFLQSVALTATTLLPNFVAVTLDAATSQNVQPDETVLGALRQKYAALGICVAQKKTVGSMLDVASRSNLATGVFVDNAEHLYTRRVQSDSDDLAEPDFDSSWEQVHEVLEDFSGCAFFAGSASILPHMVLEDRKRLGALGYSVVRTTLNCTKMRIKPLGKTPRPMEVSARAFMVAETTEAPRAEAYWKCYQKQTQHALAASQEHERCMGLQYGVQSAEFARALQNTSMLAARLAALMDFAREQRYAGSDTAEAREMEQSAQQLSMSRYCMATGERQEPTGERQEPEAHEEQEEQRGPDEHDEEQDADE